eukprot:8469887-Pyramimonas_sp.AAC.1
MPVIVRTCLVGKEAYLRRAARETKATVQAQARVTSNLLSKGVGGPETGSHVAAAATSRRHAT